MMYPDVGCSHREDGTDTEEDGGSDGHDGHGGTAAGIGRSGVAEKAAEKASKIDAQPKKRPNTSLAAQLQTLTDPMSDISEESTGTQKL